MTDLTKGTINYPASLKKAEKHLSLSGADGLDPTWIDRTKNVILDSATVANTTDETTILTEPIAGGTLYRGQVIMIRVVGQFSTANSSSAFTLRVKMGTTTIATVESDPKTVSNKPWSMEYLGTVRAINGDGYISSYIETRLDDILHVDNAPNQNFDTSVAEDVTVTIQWNEADPGDSIEANQGFMVFKGIEQYE